MRIWILLLLIGCIFLTTTAPPPPVSIKEVEEIYNGTWYSGYLNITFDGTIAHMHYFYFPSQSATKTTDPVLFWFNGGPGCSSLLGALYEHGPFFFNDAFGFLVNNPDAWNNHANVVYI
jgi:carboxypeptidase C (cathepsin A)